MSESIFLVRGGELTELRPAAYTSEDLLQGLLAQFPLVLAGEMNGVPNRWLLIDREPGVPDDDDAPDRWALDHLFLDQEAVPTFVEVKLARDTRIRREVVGQMLDYAANSVVYWPVERMRELFLSRCEREGLDPQALLTETAGPSVDLDGYWVQAGENLRAGKLRLVFVADRIPKELRRIIEFLNGQMTADVLGIEVKQYLGDELTTLVPTVIGQTADAEARKRTARATRQWNEETFFALLAAKTNPGQTRLIRSLYDWVTDQRWTHTFGTGAVDGSWQPTLTTEHGLYRPLTVYTNGAIEIRLGALARQPPFDDLTLRREYLQRLNQLPTLNISEQRIDGYPKINTVELASDKAAESTLLDILRWFAQAAVQPFAAEQQTV